MWNLLLSLLGTYALICFAAWVLHRYFLYMPDKKRYAPREVGLADVEEITLEGKGGVKLIAWYQPAERGKPTLLYFTGNSGSAANRARKIEAIAASGYGVFMLNYRRYGGSGGWPTERNNIADAVSAYQYLQDELGVAPRNIVAYGESLGTGVATRLALLRQVKALVLEAPFTSVVDVGRQVWWFLPLRLVMTDQYRTIDRIGSVKVPLLIVHGARDSMIPVNQARAGLCRGQRAEDARHPAPRGSQRFVRSRRLGKGRGVPRYPRAGASRDRAPRLCGAGGSRVVARLTPNSHSSCPATRRA